MDEKFSLINWYYSTIIFKKFFPEQEDIYGFKMPDIIII